MLTNKQKLRYIEYFTIRSIVSNNAIMPNSESYQRKLRIEILPALQLHLNTEEIKMLVPLVKNLGNKIISICGNKESYLAKESDSEFEKE